MIHLLLRIVGKKLRALNAFEQWPLWHVSCRCILTRRVPKCLCWDQCLFHCRAWAREVGTWPHSVIGLPSVCTALYCLTDLDRSGIIPLLDRLPANCYIHCIHHFCQAMRKINLIESDQLSPELTLCKLLKYVKVKNTDMSYYMYNILYRLYSNILESHNPIFFWSNGLDHFFWSLRLWSSGTTCVRVATAFYGLFSTKCRKNTVLLRVGLCESCYGFLRFFTVFFNKMLKKYGFSTGRTAMFFWFDHFFWSFQVTTIFYPKKKFTTAFSHNDQKILFLAFQDSNRYIVI